MQFSLFGAEATPRTLADLDGLIVAGGDFARADHGRTARLSIVVAASWRARALVAEFAGRGLSCETAETPSDRLAVRSEFCEQLVAPAERWIRGAGLSVPPDLELTSQALRLWAIARGRGDETGYLLGCRGTDDPLNRIGGSQLARLGVASVQVGVRGEPGWRVTSAKRLRRLAELVGAAPDGAGQDWPGA